MRGGTGDTTPEPSKVTLQPLRTMCPAVWNVPGIGTAEDTVGIIVGTCPPTYWRWSHWIGANRRLMRIKANTALSHPKATLGWRSRAGQLSQLRGNRLTST